MTQDSKVISIKDRIATLDSAEVQAMKSLMLAVREAEEKSPDIKANEIVNDLVDFMLLLTQNDCQTFARSVRQITDGVVDARSTHGDKAPVLLDKDSKDLTDHQRLVRSIQGDLQAMGRRSLDQDIAQAIESAGFSPRRPIPAGPSEFDLELERDIESIRQQAGTTAETDVEARLRKLEEIVLGELSEIKNLLASKL